MLDSDVKENWLAVARLSNFHTFIYITKPVKCNSTMTFCRTVLTLCILFFVNGLSSRLAYICIMYCICYRKRLLDIISVTYGVERYTQKEYLCAWPSRENTGPGGQLEFKLTGSFYKKKLMERDFHR